MRDPDGEDREFVEAVERHHQHHHGDGVGRRKHSSDRRGRDDRVAPRTRKLLASHDPGPLEDHEQDREEKGGAESEQEMGDEAQIVADAWQRLLLDAADIPLIAEQEVERPGHCQEVGKAGAPSEKHRRRQKERQKGVFFLGVEARRDEPP